MNKGVNKGVIEINITNVVCPTVWSILKIVPHQTEEFIELTLKARVDGKLVSEKFRRPLSWVLDGDSLKTTIKNSCGWWTRTSWFKLYPETFTRIEDLIFSMWENEVTTGTLSLSTDDFED